MNRQETATILAIAAGFDSRTIGEADVAAWQQIVAEYTFDDARDAVVEHYRRSRDRVMPADVVALVRELRNARAERAHNEAMRELLRSKPSPALESSVKAAADAFALASGRDPDGVRAGAVEQRRLLSVPCPWCRAKVGAQCVSAATGGPLLRSKVHPSRAEKVGESVGGEQ